MLMYNRFIPFTFEREKEKHNVGPTYHQFNRLTFAAPSNLTLILITFMTELNFHKQSNSKTPKL